MRLLYNDIIYNCMVAEKNESNKAIFFKVENSIEISNNEIILYFKDMKTLEKCFNDLLIHGYVNADDYWIY